MMSEFWAILAALLAGLAGLASGLAIVRLRGPWTGVAVVARSLSAVSLVVALILAVAAGGKWSPFDLQQVTLALVLAMLIVHLALAWRLGLGDAGLAVDLLALVLLLAKILIIQPGAPLLDCAQRAVPFQVQWVLFLLGAGAILVAGCAALMLALRLALSGQWPDLDLASRSGFLDLLTQATFLALVALGSGLVVSAWWAWWAVGTLSSGDPREGWMAMAWLVAAMSLSAWQLEDRRGRWAAVWAVTASAIVLLGLLVVLDLQQVMGI